MRRTPTATVPPSGADSSSPRGHWPTAVLLHGIGAIWRAWSPVLPYLEPHHDVIVPTLPGHAGGPPLDVQGAPSVAALADGIEAELDRLGMPTVTLVGLQ
jgi:pimeloyl-ACP methyl ester carboxylesterase